MATEKSMYKWLLKAKDQLIRFSNSVEGSEYENIHEAFHIERVENMIGTSTPDVEGCFLGSSFHIELKQCDRPIRKTTRLKIRFEEGQTDWLKARSLAGGACFVLLQINGIRRMYDRKYLIPGKLAKILENPKYVDNPLLEHNISEFFSLKVGGEQTALDYFFEIILYSDNIIKDIKGKDVKKLYNHLKYLRSK